MKLILLSPLLWSNLSITKTEKTLEKIVLWQQHHLRLDVAEKQVSMPSCQVKVLTL